MSTIQECASMESLERRERRKQKILANSERRVAAILSSHNGLEHRKAPIIEGLNFSYKRNASTTCNVTVDFVEPPYWNFVGRTRLLVMALFTFGFACLFEFGLISSVVLPMAIVSAAYEFGFALPQKCRNYPIHGYLVNFLLMGGLNEHVVVVLGHCIDLLWNYAMDLFVCVLSFLATTVTIETVGRAFGAFL